MKIAAFNVENLFDRAKVFNDDSAATRQDVLDAYAELNKLFEKAAYTDVDKARMLELIEALGMLDSDEGSDKAGPLAGFTRIRRIRGSYIRRPTDKTKPREIVAAGRESWVGWCELKTEAVDEVAMMNTARVIRDVAADVLAVVEAENRPVLKRFHELLSKKLQVPAIYRHIMLIDGNDDRGIDVGLATVDGYPIGAVTSHVDLRMPGKPNEALFSRDCPVYTVTTPQGARLHVVPNHFKSKFNDNPAKRRAQARATADIYRGLRAAGEDNVVILGDLNDTPDSPVLTALLAQTDLREVTDHPGFTEFEFPANLNGQRGIGTHGLGNDDDKIDYILLSPALFARMQRGGIFRMGAWPGSRPKRWAVYPELTNPDQAASDHHAIWAEIDI